MGIRIRACYAMREWGVLVMLQFTATPIAIYTGSVARVIDGDTFVADLLLARHVLPEINGVTETYVTRSIRLLGYDAAELHGGDSQSRYQGQLDRAKLVDLLPIGTRVNLIKHGESFGRWVCKVRLSDNSDIVSLLTIG